MKKDLTINETRKTFNWSILILVSLTSILTGLYRDGFASLFPFLQKDFNLTRAQLGLHSTLFNFTSAFLAIYTGRLVDLKGSKWGLVFSSILMGIFYILHSIAPNFLVVLFIATLTGISISFNVPTVNKCIVEWFSKKERSTALGIQSIAFPIGGLLGAIVLPFFGSLIGWRKTMILPGIVAILGALLLLRFYQEKNDLDNNLLEYEKNSVPFWKSISQLIKNAGLIKVSIFGFFLGMMANSISSHFSLFLFLDYNLSERIAGVGFAIVQLGSILGRVFWGIFCDKALGSDKSKTFLFMGTSFWLTTVILNLGLKHLNTPSISLFFLFAFLMGCFGNAWPGIFCASITETVTEESVGIAIGFAYLFIRTGMMIAPPIFGYIADLKNSYSLSWFLLGITMLFASLGQYLLSRKKRIESS